jgi:hypothetical protein
VSVWAVALDDIENGRVDGRILMGVKYNRCLASATR